MSLTANNSASNAQKYSYTISAAEYYTVETTAAIPGLSTLGAPFKAALAIATLALYALPYAIAVGKLYVFKYEPDETRELLATISSYAKTYYAAQEKFKQSLVELIPGGNYVYKGYERKYTEVEDGYVSTYVNVPKEPLRISAKEYKRLQNEIEKLKKEATSNSNKSNDGQVLELQKKLKASEDFKTKFEKANKEIDTLKASLDKATKEHSHARLAEENLKTEIKSLNEKLALLDQGEKSPEVTEKLQLINDKANIQLQLNVKDEELSEAQTTVESSRQRIAELESTLAQAEQDKKTAEASAEKAKLSADKLQEQVNKLIIEKEERENPLHEKARQEAVDAHLVPEKKGWGLFSKKKVNKIETKTPTAVKETPVAVKEADKTPEKPKAKDEVKDKDPVVVEKTDDKPGHKRTTSKGGGLFGFGKTTKSAGDVKKEEKVEDATKKEDKKPVVEKKEDGAPKSPGAPLSRKKSFKEKVKDAFAIKGKTVKEDPKKTDVKETVVTTTETVKIEKHSVATTKPEKKEETTTPEKKEELVIPVVPNTEDDGYISDLTEEVEVVKQK